MFRLLLLLAICCLPLSAATYNLTSGSYPPCSTSWSVSGTTYTCSSNGRVTLSNGDIVTSNSAVTIRANNGFSLNGATIGSSSNAINLVSDYGSVTSSNTNTLWGNIQATSSAITLNNTVVNGTVSSAGAIVLTAGSVNGKVTSSANTITTTGTNLSAGATAQSGFSISGGVISGAFTLTSNNVATFSNVVMSSGSISGASTVSISNSQLGTLSSSVTVSSNNGDISLSNGSLVYGVLTAPNYATVNVPAGSTVYGRCLPNSTPANACTPLPLAHYPLDLCADVTTGVIDDLMGTYPAQGFNVAASSAGQVLEAANLSATGNDYISVPATVLNAATDFSLTMWFKLDAGSGFRELFSASNNSIDNELELYINSSNELRAGLKGSYYTFSGGSTSPVVSNNTWYQVSLTRSAAQLCLYLNDSLVNCTNASSSSLSVTRSAVGIWWQANGNVGDDFRGTVDEVQLYNSALTISQIQQMYVNQQAGKNFNGSTRTSSCSQCLTDNFSAASLSDSWVTARSSGSFTPSIVAGRLRMTEAVGNQATSATFQRLYPAANNLVVVEFDYWAYGGSSADGLTVVLSDASITPQPGAAGGALGYGYKPGVNGFAGGWLGFGLDEYGNFSAEGGSYNIGRRRQSVVIRGSGSGTSGYRYLRGTCSNGTTNTGGNCLSPLVDGNQTSPHRYRFTIDSRTSGQTLVSVQRNAGAGFETLISPFNAQTETGQAAVPANFLLSLTGSTGGSTNIHELDNVSICALRSSAVGQQIDHFELDYSGQALTCKPETFTVRACKNASCSELITTPVSASLSPVSVTNGGWTGGNVVNFSAGTTSIDFRQPAAGNVTVGVSSSVPATKPLSTTLCRAGASALSAAACNVNFADSGLLYSIPDGIANLPDNNVVISAVKKSDASQQCVPSFANVSRSVSFWSDYITPDANARPVSWPITVNGTNVGLTNATATALTLNFDSQGKALVNINYADAGNVQLNARYNGSAGTADPGLVMTGADQFIRRPAGLCVKTSGACAAADASCGKFTAAGQAFSLSISAHAYDASAAICNSPLTPNFEKTGLSLSHSLLAPASGDSGTLGVTSYNHSRNTLAQTVVSQTVSEVGVFQFNVPAFSYQTMTSQVPLASSIASGRFVPDHFDITAGTAVAACSAAFSYYGQKSFSTSFSMQARNASGGLTRNYTGSFARLNPAQWTDTSSATGMRYSAPGLPAGSSLLQGAMSPLGTWSNGSTDIISSHYASRPTAVAPPLALTVFAKPVDSDGVTLSAALPLHSTTTELRFGRLVLDNGYGPEDENLPLSFSTEYWDGSKFVLNVADSCTLVSPTVAYSTVLAEPATADLTLGGVGGSLQNGRFPAALLYINATNSDGSWRLQYPADTWLKYNWRDSATGFAQDPQADFLFGRFRGNPRQIYWRELF